jgi:hypothetical protein
MPLADDAVRALRNARQREIQDQQLADQAARQMRANRTQQTEQVRMRGPRTYEEIQDRYQALERRLEGLTPGGRAGFDDILRENLEEEMEALRSEVDARGVAESIDVPPEYMQAVEEQPVPVQQQQARPRNPRNWAFTLPDGIHTDNKGVPFKVENKRIVRMTDEELQSWEAARAAQQNEASLEEGRAFAGMTEEEKLAAFRESEEFKLMQQRNLRTLREERILAQQRAKFARMAEERRKAEAKVAAKEKKNRQRERPKQEAEQQKFTELNDGIYQDEAGTLFKVENSRIFRMDAGGDVEILNNRDADLSPVAATEAQGSNNVFANLEKQLFTADDLDNLSAENAAARVVSFNEDINIHVRAGDLTEEEGQELLDQAMGVIDGSNRREVIYDLLMGDTPDDGLDELTDIQPTPVQQQQAFAGLEGALSRSRTGDERMLDRIDRAMEQRQAGASNAEVFENTGVFFPDPDQPLNPRWEIDDSAATFDETLFSNYVGSRVELRELLDHPDLYETYPLLEDVEIEIKELPLEHYGQVVWGRRGNPPKVIMNSELGGQIDEDPKEILMHEIQHLIQNLEGWVSGSNPGHELAQLFANDELFRNQLEVHLGDQFVASAMAQKNGDDSYESILKSLREKMMENRRTKKQYVDGGIMPTSPEIERLDEQYSGLINLTDRLQELDRRAFRNYFDNIGEAEAREVERRVNMGAMSRRDQMPSIGLEPDIDLRPRRGSQ